MKNKPIAIYILLLLPFLTFSQTEVKKRVLLGTETGGTIVRGKDPVTGDKVKFTNMRFGPYLGYFLRKDFVLGITGEYEFVKSTYVEADPLYGIGVFARYFLPFRIDKVNFLADRLLFITEASYLKINYYPTGDEEITAFPEWREKVFRLNLGINFRIWKQLYLEKSFRAEHFFNRRSRWSHRFGIEYHF